MSANATLCSAAAVGHELPVDVVFVLPSSPEAEQQESAGEEDRYDRF
jgi:hypothetical protein